MRKFWEDFAPLILFFLLNAYGAEILGRPESDSLFIATAGFMVALAIIIALQLMGGRKPSLMSLITAGFVFVFGGLTLYLQDEMFIKMKPTLVYILCASILFFGLWRGQSYLKILMGNAMPLDEAGWLIFTRNWAIFFVILGVINEIVWRNFSTDFWVSFKLFGFTGLSVAFIIAHMPLLKNHLQDMD